MGMATDDTVRPMLPRAVRHARVGKINQLMNREFESAAKYSKLGTVLGIGMNDVAVIPEIYFERARVADTAHHRKPSITVNRTVELVAVNHQHAAVVGGAMQEKRMTFDRAEKHSDQLAVMLIMIARNKD